MSKSYDYNIVENWVHEECQIEFLADSILDEGITIFLGSGVSKGFGLPLWSELMEKLAKKVGVDTASFDTNLKLARHIRDVKLNKNQVAFNEILTQVLYEDAKTSFYELRKHHTLAAVFSILMISKGRNPTNVVTLNYDDILETYLNFHGVRTESCFGKKIGKKNVDVMVYHPHGFLPHRNLHKQHKQQKVIITSSDYAKTVGDVQDPWHILVLEKLLTTRPIFVGLGTDDLNLANLLAKSHEKNVKSLPPYYGIAFAKDPSEDIVNDWQEYGIFCKSTSDYEECAAKFLFQVCQNTADKM